jgi:broad-specificity NMP kinase
MCCVMYYLYIKCRDYVRQRSNYDSNDEDDDKYSSEIKYTAKQLDDYVRNKTNLLVNLR